MTTIYRVKYLPVIIERDFPQNQEENTVEVLISRHPWYAKKVSVTGAGCLLEFKNTDFVWELRRTGFCEGSYK